MIRRDGDWLSARVGDEILMMSEQKGNYLGLNEVGARIYDLLATPMEIDALYAAIEREFEVDPVTCRQEVDAFVDRLAALGAIAVE